MLSAQRSVRVPLFEDLDRRNFVREQRGRTLAAVLDDVFRTGRHSTRSHATTLYACPDHEVASIGFKMRLFGSAAEIAPTLRAHRVKLFVLSRRDLVEVVSSLYVSEVGRLEQGRVALSQHPQFHLFTLSEEEKARYLRDLDSIRLAIRGRKFVSLARSFVRRKRRLLQLAAELAAEGIEIVPIYYEDFVADRIGFIGAILRELGFPADSPVVDASKFVKVMTSPARSKLHGLGWYAAWPPLQYYRLAYAAELRKLEGLRRPARS
jgi:hypothetical protein